MESYVKLSQISIFCFFLLAFSYDFITYTLTLLILQLQTQQLTCSVCAYCIGTNYGLCMLRSHTWRPLAKPFAIYPCVLVDVARNALLSITLYF